MSLRDRLSALSIELKMPLVISGLLVLVVGTLSVTAYVTVRRSEERLAREQLLSTTAHVSGTISTATRRLVSHVEALAGEPALDPSRLASAGDATLDALRFRSDKPEDVIALELRDPEGVRTRATGQGVDAVSTSTWVLGSDATPGQAVVGRIRRIGDDIIFPMSAPMTRGGRLLGYLVQWRRLTLAITVRGGRFLLANRDGSLVTDLTKEVARPPLPFSALASVVRYQRSDFGGPCLAAAAEIPGTPWIGVAETQVRTFLEPLRQFGTRLAILSVLLIGIGLAFAWPMSRRLTRPLRQLTAAATAISSGDYSQRVEVRRQDEIGQLARSFNEMAEQVQRTLQALEKNLEELSRTQRQLESMGRMEAVGRLAGGVAHDFNNILTAVNGFAELALSQMAPDDPHAPVVGEIRAAGERAVELTRQLLLFSRNQAVEMRIVDLNEVVHGLDRMLRRLIRENIDLDWHPGPERSEIRADPGRLEQLIVNLVVNARDAMTEGGRLTIEARNVELDEAYARGHISVTPGSYVLLSVTDTGIGMSGETRAHAFEPFYSTKAPGKGTGLGLATVYGIVKQCDGHIWIYSEPGHGTSFKVYFPRVRGETAEPPAEPAVMGTLLHGNETVLLVEDDDGVRSLARQILSSSGYEVIEAAGPEAALQKVAAHAGPIDLVVTDIVMPGGSGPDLMRRLIASRPDLRSLYMSGYSDRSVLGSGLLAEGSHFLEKPFTPRAFAEKVREALAPRS